LVEERILGLCNAEVDEILDQFVQPPDVRLQDAYDLALLPVERARNLVVQQLDAFANGGERRLELVRDVPEDRHLVLLEAAQALPQPVELPAELLEVARSLDTRHLGGVALPERLDGARDLGDRTVDEEAVNAREDERGRNEPERVVDEPPLGRVG